EEFPCGLRLAASNGAESGPASGVVYEWHTVFPGRSLPIATKWAMAPFADMALRNSAVAAGQRRARNPYQPVRKSGDPDLGLNEAGRVTVLRRDDLTRPAGAADAMTTTEAARLIDALPEGRAGKLQLVAVGLAA